MKIKSNRLFMNSKEPILLIEDDEVEAMIVKRALKQLEVSNQIIHKKNGEEALEYLTNTNNTRPCIMLLDLNMPRMNGIEFLKHRNKHADLKAIPTVVLTTSKYERDKQLTYELGISGYMVKPINYDEFVSVIKVINQYWTTSEYPS